MELAASMVGEHHTSLGTSLARRDAAALLDLQTDWCLAIYAERDVLGHVPQVAPVFQRELRRFADHPLVARRVGLVGALEMVRQGGPDAFDSSLKVGPRIARAAREHGLHHARDG